MMTDGELNSFPAHSDQDQVPDGLHFRLAKERAVPAGIRTVQGETLLWRRVLIVKRSVPFL